MAYQKPFLRSFAGGEITPEMFGRLDLDKFQTGLSNSENFEILPHGPAANRPGFGYILRTKNRSIARVIPFAFNAEQTAVLEFSDQAITFHTNGSTVVEAALNITSITQASPPVVSAAGHTYINGERVFINGVLGMSEINGRYYIVDSAVAGVSFALLNIDDEVFSSAGYGAYTADGFVSRVYSVTTTYTDSQIFDIHYTQSADVLTLVHPDHPPRELRRLGAANWQLIDITFIPSLATPLAPTLAAVGPGGGTPVSLFYKTTAVSAAGVEESLASPSATISIDLTVVGNSVSIDPTPGGATVPGAVRYRIYKQKNGLFGYIGENDGSVFSDDNIAPDTTSTPPEANNPFVGTGNYPSTVTYFEQRRCFAATDNLPQHHWLTRSGTESNLSQSVPVRDDDAIIFRIAANQQNRIRNLVPLTDLLSLTVGAEWRITPASGDFLTPTVVPRPQSYVGSSNVQPVVTSSSCLYVQAQSSRIRELSYGGEASNYGYRSLDVSILAPHLFDGYTVVDAAYSRAPVQIAWFVRSDGVLLGMTYVPEQNVRAWHHHTTDGEFLSVCCVAEGDEDVLYAVVRRYFGPTLEQSRVSVERLRTRRFADLADAFFVDSGLSYSGSPTTLLRGLEHLAGRTVSALADGAVIEDLVVSADGTVTLPAAASVAHVGLPYTARMDTLPLALETPGYGQGAMKNVNKAHVRVSESSGMFVGPYGKRLFEAKQRTTEPYGSPPDLYTGTQSVAVVPDWQKDGVITIEQRAPLPLTVLSIAVETQTT